MPVLDANDLVLLRKDHKARVYGSFLKPLTLWTARVNSGGLSRADVSIPFDGGAGSHYSAIEAYQEVWIGTSAASHDVAKIRIKAISSGDAGVTGTLTVAPNNVIWADDMYLTFIHNYPFRAMYPFIDGGEVFYKDTTITYSDQNEDTAPITIGKVWPRAQRLRDGSATVYIDASDSYATKQGETIASYTCTVYPTANATVTFNGGTGIGRLVVTSSDPDYRWLKFTSTDSNGKSQSTWRCVFIHGENPDDTNYPHVDFATGQMTGNWEGGGWSMSLTAHDDVDLPNIPDEAFACIWRERQFGNKDKNIVQVNNVLFYNPQITFRVNPGAPCSIAATFHAGVMIDGYPDNGTNISITLNASGGATDTQNANTSSGTLDISSFVLAGADCSGTLDAVYSGTTIFSVNYRNGEIFTGASEYASELVCLPKELIVGYVRGEKLNFDDATGSGIDTIDITTVEGLVKNEFMFSISLAARPSGIDKWYEYNDDLTIGRACHHIWKWHSTLFEVADVVGLLDNTDGRAYAEFENGTLYTMPDNMARQAGIRAHVTCNKLGQVHLTQDVQLLLDADRAGLTTVATVTDDDYRSLALPRKPEDRVALVYGSGLEFLGTFSADESGELQPDVEAYCAMAPGSKPSGQGEGVINFERQVLTSQVQLNQLVGRVYGQANNLYPDLRLDFSGDYLDVFDVHLAEFWEIDIATTDTIKELAIPDLKLIVRDITATINVDSGDIETHVTFEPEMAAQIGVTTECPGPPTDLGGEIPTITVDGIAGAIVTASSVEYLPPDSSSWDQRHASTTHDIIQDPFWRTRQGSSASEDAILIRCGTGVIQRSVDAGQNWSVITPGSNPPNDAGDAPAPTVGNVTFEMADGSYIYQSEFVVLANWQNAGGDWRSWLAYTDDDGVSWTWKYLGGITTCSNPGTPTTFTGNIGSNGNPGNAAMVQVDSEIYVYIGVDGSDDFYVRGFDVTGGTITDGTPLLVHNCGSGVGVDYPAICKVDTNKFFMVYKCASWYVRAGTINSGTLAITLGASVLMFTADERNEWSPAHDPPSYIRCVAPSTTEAIVYGANIPPQDPGDSCSPGNNGHYILRCAISGTAVTPDDTTCGGNTVRDWIEVDISTENNPRDHAIADCGNGSHYILAYTDEVGGTPDTLYARAGTSTTLGSRVDLGSNVNTTSYAPEVNLIVLSSTESVAIWADEQSPAGDRNIIRAVLITRSGTGLTVDSVQTLHDPGGGSLLYPLYLQPYKIDSDQFGLYFSDADVDYDCNSLLRVTVNLVNGVMTVDDTCLKWQGSQSGQVQTKLITYSSTEFFQLKLNETPYEAYLHDTIFSCAGSGDSRGLGLSIGKSVGSKIWITTGNDSILELLEVALPGLTIDQRLSLGSATWAQISANTYIARPFAAFGDDDEVWIGGRMDTPQGLAAIEHVIGTGDGGSSFSSVENLWGADHCGSLYVTPGGVAIAIRNASGSSKLYIGDALGLDLKSTTILSAGVSWKAIALDFGDASIILGNNAGGTYMVVVSVPPYLDWWDLTSDHPTGNGINAIELL